jgi:hypothetical protein
MVRLATAASFAFAALALLAVAVIAMTSANSAGSPDHLRQQEQLNSSAVGALGDGVVPVSYGLAPISARRTISDPGLNSPLSLSAGGRKITVTGHLGCIKGDQYKIQTSVTQRSTGALAKGETSGVCTGKQEQFSAPTWVYDEALFTPGPAQACAVLIIRTNGKAADAYQWCRKEDAMLTGPDVSY